MFSTGASPKHKLYKYYINSRPAANASYPKEWILYYTTNPDLTLDSPEGTNPATQWVAIDMRTEQRSGFTSGMTASTGCMYNIPDADNYQPFAALKIKILSHYGTTANYSTIGRIQFFTVDTSKFEEGLTFKIDDYFGIPPTSDVPSGFTR